MNYQLGQNMYAKKKIILANLINRQYKLDAYT